MNYEFHFILAVVCSPKQTRAKSDSHVASMKIRIFACGTDGRNCGRVHAASEKIRDTMKRLLLIILICTASVAQAARETYPLDAGWRFFFQHENGGDAARPITLPHTWNLDALAGCYPYLRTQGNYLRELYVPREWQGRRLFLRFGGVESVADLFVNGVLAGEHRGGTTAFAVEITDRVRFGAVNRLLVAVSNAPRPDVLPTSAEHNLYGGIHRSVELLVTDPVAVSPLYYGSDGVLIRPASITAERVEGIAEIHLVASGDATARVTLTAAGPDGREVFTRTQKIHVDRKPLAIPFAIDKPALWSPAQPDLYRFEVRVESDDGSDGVCVTTGFRRIEVDAREGMRINDRPTPVRGATLWYDRAGSGPISDRADYAEDLALLRDLGANALRSPAGPHSDELYDLCDREGLLVWIDLPFLRAPYMGELSYYATTAFEENGTEQLRELIVQHFNRPSVVMWGLFSSLRPVDPRLKGYIARLNDEAHAIDPSRPTVACSNQNGEINFITDLIVWRQDVGWVRGTTDDAELWSEQLHRNWGDLRSGVCYGAPGDPSRQPDRYERAADHSTELPERRQTRFHEEYARQLAADTLFWGVWIDCLADYGSARSPLGRNLSGLVSFDRTERKDAYYLYRAMWNERQPTLHIAEKRWTPRLSERQTLTVYSSAEEAPTCLVGADTVPLTRCAPGRFRSEELTLGPETRIVVIAGELRDSTVIRCGDPLKEPLPTDPLRTIGLPPTN